MSSFLAIETALSGLRAAQLALDVSSHNVANVNNPNYSRQVANLTAAFPIPSPTLRGGLLAGQVGTGVTVESIQRMFDGFTFRSLQSAQNQQSLYAASTDTLQSVEKIINEPSTTGIASALGNFFNSLQQLSTQPEDLGARAVVVQNADYLAQAFRTTTQNLTNAQKQLDQGVASATDQINSLTHQIADLNKSIVSVKSGGDTPNDLLDQRDTLVQQLSQLTDVQTAEDSSGSLSVFANGQPLVSQFTTHDLKVQTNAQGFNAVVFADTGNVLTTNGGKLKGLLDGRDVALPGYMSSLNAIASSLMTAINTQHRAGTGLDGSTGLDFFTGSGAQDIQVNSALMQDPQKLAASGSGAAGDGSNALALANVRDTKLLSGGTATLEEAYASFVGALGVQSQNSQNMKSHFDTIVQQLQNQRDSVSSVSIDEEMVNVMRFQQGYSAAAKVISSADQMTQALLGILS